MDNLLLEKIEELTLYTIKQNRTIQKLQKENNTLKQKTEKIKNLQKKLDNLEKKVDAITDTK